MHNASAKNLEPSAEKLLLLKKCYIYSFYDDLFFLNSYSNLSFKVVKTSIFLNPSIKNFKQSGSKLLALNQKYKILKIKKKFIQSYLKAIFFKEMKI